MFWPCGTLRVYPEDTASGSWEGATSSAGGGEEVNVTVTFSNDTDLVLELCWVDSEGELHHFYPLHPARGPRAIVDGSVRPEHTEITQLGDTFVVYRTDGLSPEERRRLVHVRDVPAGARVALYTPTGIAQGSAHRVMIRKDEGEDVVNVTVGGSGDSGADRELWDSSQKHMEATTLAGFAVRYEPGVWEANTGLKAAMERDLEAVGHILPPHTLAG